MKRRSFFTGLIGVAAAALAIPKIFAKAEPQDVRPLQLSPVFGKYVIPIHPYDFYELVGKATHADVIKVNMVGETGIPVLCRTGQWYLSAAPIVEFNGKLYMRTATVPPVTKNIF